MPLEPRLRLAINTMAVSIARIHVYFTKVSSRIFRVAVIIPYFPWIVNISAAHPPREYLPFRWFFG
jgi:hypothetical protein